MMVRLISETLKASRKSSLVLGPRQVGKSTLLRSLSPDLTINLAKESEYHLHLGNPARLEEIVEAQTRKTGLTVFIDEIQRIPALLNSVQALIDESNGGIRFLLSGSSARKLKRGQANLLPGRVMVHHLGGLCGDEIPIETPTPKLVQYGLLPEIALNRDESFCASLLDSYASTYIREEIQAEAVVQNLGGFTRFLEQASASAGQILDYSKLAKQAKISRTTCVRFFDILQDTLLVDRCEIFKGCPEEDTIKHPKYFFFDVGVRNALTGSFELSPERKGIIFEHFVFNQIKNALMARGKKARIEYFRTRSGLEIDFMVTLNSQVWAIEVKSGEVHADDLKPIEGFKRLYAKPVRSLAVSLQEKVPRKSKDTLICDWRTMLKEMGL